MIQLIARQLLIVFNRRREIAVDGRCHGGLDVDVRQALSQDGAVGAGRAGVVRSRLLGLQLLTKMGKVLTRR